MNDLYVHSDTDSYGDGDVPEVDSEPYQANYVEPLPESSRPRRNGPGGE